MQAFLEPNEYGKQIGNIIDEVASGNAKPCTICLTGIDETTHSDYRNVILSMFKRPVVNLIEMNAGEISDLMSYLKSIVYRMSEDKLNVVYLDAFNNYMDNDYNMLSNVEYGEMIDEYIETMTDRDFTVIVMLSVRENYDINNLSRSIFSPSNRHALIPCNVFADVSHIGIGDFVAYFAPEVEATYDELLDTNLIVKLLGNKHIDNKTMRDIIYLAQEFAEENEDDQIVITSADFNDAILSIVGDDANIEKNDTNVDDEEFFDYKTIYTAGKIVAEFLLDDKCLESTYFLERETLDKARLLNLEPRERIATLLAMNAGKIAMDTLPNKKIDYLPVDNLDELNREILGSNASVTINAISKLVRDNCELIGDVAGYVYYAIYLNANTISEILEEQEIVPNRYSAIIDSILD